ncbi:hypothetical protein ACH5RR_013277 [Cinchona calisaya]|uniref:Uncharacterized protein n=1 Tax=Cinchona calisaya TaxID=153742 RepID=A0ABD3A2V8_9GENT
MSGSEATVLRCEVQEVMITPGYALGPLTGTPEPANDRENLGRSKSFGRAGSKPWLEPIGKRFVQYQARVESLGPCCLEVAEQKEILPQKHIARKPSV